MNAFIVRFDDEGEHPHELVGIFFCANLFELCRLVDECTDVEGCEYIKMPKGGLYWGGRTMRIPDYSEDFDPAFDTSTSEPVMTEGWFNVVDDACGGDDRTPSAPPWHPLAWPTSAATNIS